jgi:hypothetical protein
LPGSEDGGYHFEPMNVLSDSFLVWCWVALLTLNAQAGPPAKTGGEKSAPAPANARAVSVVRSGEGVKVTAPSYRFDWTAARDEFRLADSQGRTIVSGRIAPVVTVQPLGKAGARKLVSATVQNWSLEGEQLKIGYREASGSHEVEIAIKFAPGGIWLEPIRFQAGEEDVVSVHYFSRSDGQAVTPAMQAAYWVIPGINEASALGPIVSANLGLSATLWSGRGACGEPGLSQQWGLPAHFFCGFSPAAGDKTRGALSTRLSGSFCCGLASLPAADYFLDWRGATLSPVFSYRSDLWGQCRGPARLTLGARLLLTVAPDYREAIRQYYLGLVEAGVIHKKVSSSAKVKAMLAPQFNSWGAEVALGKASASFDSAAFHEIWGGLQASGMKPAMFVFDDKWEGAYGHLEHSRERFPDFEQILGELRQHGLKIGLWAAFLRVEHPEDAGLSISNVLHKADGTPYKTGGYYMLDVTQPEAQQAIRNTARRFIRHYQPDLVKFDFGYELPSLALAAPADKGWAGERLLYKGLEVVASAMREEKPDIVMMYYSLSPLFVDYLDLHSPDDLFLCAHEYDLEANRRFFFSSLLGELGMPTYGSGGYDWATMPSIWFDSAPIGTLGSLGAFSGDENGQRAEPECMAKFNGLSHALRDSACFSVEPYEADYLGYVRGAHTSSWVRRENGKVVLIALRKHRLDGREGSGRYGDWLMTTASVVIASKTDDDLETARQLAIVPYGDGELRLKRHNGPHIVREHFFGGKVTTSRTRASGGVLRLKLRQQSAGGVPLEWVEVLSAQP